MSITISRRRFIGGMVAAAGLIGLKPDLEAWSESTGPTTSHAVTQSVSEYDNFAKLAFNENPYGPAQSVLKAMMGAFKYANRYNSPDNDIVQAIADHHGVKPANILLGNGSTEILDVAGTTFLRDAKEVVGVEPTYGTVYEWARGMQSPAIKVPLLADHRQDIPGIIKTAKQNRHKVGFVYLCNPNNPTGMIIHKDEIRQLLNELPEDMPVLMDEAYHHYVEDANYAMSVPYVLEGRPVIVTRTFSKIAGLAGMRLGYCVAPEALIAKMLPHMGGYNVNALVKWAGVAALKDTEAQTKVRAQTLALRKKTVAELHKLNYRILPSETNFFMVHIRRPVVPVIEAFRKRGVLVGRAFPPMLDYLRVSVGTADEMDRFLAAFKEIFSAPS